MFYFRWDEKHDLIQDELRHTALNDYARDSALPPVRGFPCSTYPTFLHGEYIHFMANLFQVLRRPGNAKAVNVNLPFEIGDVCTDRINGV